MVKTEHITISGHDFVRSYSDSGYYINGGMPEGDYAEAIDPAELGRTYTETDTQIEGDTSAEEILDIVLGVSK